MATCMRRVCLQVPARVLPVPMLEYGNAKCVNPGDKGAWNLLGGVSFYRYYLGTRTCWVQWPDGYWLGTAAMLGR